MYEICVYVVKKKREEMKEGDCFVFIYILHNIHYHCIYVCDVHQSDIHHRSVVVVCVIIIIMFQ